MQRRAEPIRAEKEKRVPDNTNKLSFREKRELEGLEKAIGDLEAEKTRIEADLQSGELTPEALTRCSQRFAALLSEISDISDRWLTLSDRES